MSVIAFGSVRGPWLMSLVLLHRHSSFNIIFLPLIFHVFESHIHICTLTTTKGYSLKRSLN